MGSTEILDDRTIDMLENKILALENLVYGDKKDGSSEKTSIIESLLNANTLLNAASNSRKNIEVTYKRLKELNRNISLEDNEYDFDSKLNIVLDLNDQYKDNTAILEKVNRMNKALDSGNLKGLDELQPQLAELTEQFSEFGSKFEEVNHTQNLMNTWQEVFVEVSKSILAANAAVSELEKRNSSQK